MKIPKYIEEKLHRIAKLNAELKVLDKEIEDFLTKKGIDPDELRGMGLDSNGKAGPDYLTELDNGNDVTEELIAFLKEEYKEF